MPANLNMRTVKKEVRMSLMSAAQDFEEDGEKGLSALAERLHAKPKTLRAKFTHSDAGITPNLDDILETCIETLDPTPLLILGRFGMSFTKECKKETAYHLVQAINASYHELVNVVLDIADDSTITDFERKRLMQALKRCRDVGDLTDQSLQIGKVEKA